MYFRQGGVNARIRDGVALNGKICLKPYLYPFRCESNNDPCPRNPITSGRRSCRVVVFSGVVVTVAFSGTAILVFHNPEWHPQLVRFIFRVWQKFVAYNAGSTSPGFVSSIFLSLFVLIIVAAYIASVDGFMAMREHFFETASLAVLAPIHGHLCCVWNTVRLEVATLGMKTIKCVIAKVDSLGSENSHLVDPTSRDTDISDLRKQFNNAQTQLSLRKQMIVIGDPAFDNIRNILTAFQAYRIALKGQKCVVYITAPPDSERIASLVAAFSNSVSGCFTFGPSGRGNEELDAITATGMKPGVVLIHAPRGDLAANLAEEHLSGTIPLERSYKPLTSDSPLYQDQGKGEQVLWLQSAGRADGLAIIPQKRIDET